MCASRQAWENLLRAMQGAPETQAAAGLKESQGEQKVSNRRLHHSLCAPSARVSGRRAASVARDVHRPRSL